MSEPEKIRVLILTTQRHQMDGPVQFLEKRNYETVVMDNIKEGFAYILNSKPHWVLISIDISPMIDKYVTLMTQTLNITPIVFSERLDTKILHRLAQNDCPVINGKLSGPSIQMRIRRLIKELEEKKKAKTAQRTEATMSLDSVSGAQVVAGGEKTKSDLNIISHTANAHNGPAYLAKADSGDEMSLAEAVFLNQLKKASLQLSKTTLSARSPNRLQGTEKLSVAVIEGTDLSGYLVMASSMQALQGLTEIQRLRDNIHSLFKEDQNLQEKLFGVVDAQIEDLPAWADQNSRFVETFTSPTGDLLACFVAEKTALPATQPAKLDSTKTEVSIADIPLDTALPCAFYVYLERNEKHVCLLRPQGTLSEIQRERLIKAGAETLTIAREDTREFQLFYIKEKLLKPRKPPEE